MNNLVVFKFSAKDEKLTMLNVINAVQYINDNTVIIHTKKGREEKNINEFQHPVALVSIDEIDLNDSLYYWFRKNNQHINKPILIDNTLRIGEVYNHNWPFSLLINPESTQIKVKIIKE